MSSITVLTPTYNRKEHLSKLYESLKSQTSRDFIWLVVDDGSLDGTEGLIREFQDEQNRIAHQQSSEKACKKEQNSVTDSLEEQSFQIHYIRQENGGKHRALNRGIAAIDTELTFIVDSDDYLPEEAIATICKYHAKYKAKEDIAGELCGYSFLRCHADGSVNTAYFPEDEMIGTYRDVRINGGIGGDKAEVYYTDILKQYPFAEFPGEKFLAEDVVWMQMSGPYKMVHINKNIYTCDYLEGGLTKTGHRMKIHSPRGMILRSKLYLQDQQVKRKVKLKMMLLYVVYCRFAGISLRDAFLDSVVRSLFVLCYLPAQLIYWKWKHE